MTKTKQLEVEVEVLSCETKVVNTNGEDKVEIIYSDGSKQYRSL